MKVKCNLLLALSHNAKILILDEPTSGLDPFSRDELLQLFCGATIPDIEKCNLKISYVIIDVGSPTTKEHIGGIQNGYE